MPCSIQRHPAKGWARPAPWLAGTALAVLATPSIASAQAVWNGTNSTNWFDAGNWSTNAVPNNATDATIDTVAPNPTVVGSGAASARDLVVGNAAGTTGRLTVTGAGTTLTVSSAFAVGRAGTGALVVQNGGVVDSRIGLTTMGTGGAATVTGAGSRWSSFRQTVDGTLNILNGGELLNTGQIYIGIGQPGNVTVDGAGSTLTKAGGAIYVEQNGTLTISNGGAVVGGVGFLGGRVTVTGPGSHWTTSYDLSVGGSFTVSNGGTVSSSRSVISGSSLDAAQLTVTGAGSRWNSNEMIVGSGFAGQSGYGTLNILNGGFVSSVVGVVGDNLNGTGQATIDGTTSRWTSDNLTIGNQNGATGTMTLRNGGTASAGAVLMAQSVYSVGTLSIGAASGAAAAAPGTLSAPTVTFGAGSGRIVFNHTASSYTFAPVISGAGTLLFEAGTTNLSGSSTTFTGNATVNGGTLLANGSIAASTTTVNAGGTLGGSGSVGNTTINGGTLSPGNSIGTLSVQGNLVLTAAATYLVEVDSQRRRPHQCHGHGHARRRHSARHLRQRKLRVAPLHDRERRRHLRHVQHAGQHQPAGQFFGNAELRCHERLSRRRARFGCRPEPERQSAQRCERARQLVQCHRRYSTGVRCVDTSRADAGLRRSRHRHAADDVQCDGSVRRHDDRSVFGHARGRCTAGRRERLRGRGRNPRLHGEEATQRRGTWGLRSIQGTAAHAIVRRALERVGVRLWRHAEDRRQRNDRV
jgi:T5SS/PEP-CTERM-associated repeat protein